MEKKKDSNLALKIALIILIAATVSSLVVEYMNCETSGGTLVRGLFMMKCIK